jgi:hypothetical protein
MESKVLDYEGQFTAAGAEAAEETQRELRV